ncbi:hypothetical protein N9I17_04835 [Amylibacter sp.]|jgi:hypothetical protein|nr:hypothetical protein [Amylibacter sp.]MDB4079935.1 hypothetical protein [Amylibacter sp.]
MSWVFRAAIVGLAYFFPKFRFGYGLFLIIFTQLVAFLFLLIAWADYTLGEASWIIRNEIILAICTSLIGWVLGAALIRQAEKHAAIIKESLDESIRKQCSKTHLKK